MRDLNVCPNCKSDEHTRPASEARGWWLYCLGCGHNFAYSHSLDEWLIPLSEVKELVTGAAVRLVEVKAGKTL